MRIRMMMIAGGMVSVLGVGWYVMAQNTAALPNFVSGQVLTAEDLNTVVDQVENNTAALSGGASGATIQVDCDAGDSLAQALQGVLPGRTIQVSGTCTEQVTITTDRLTLQGDGSAVIDGGGSPQVVVTIDGAVNVTLTGFTVQNGLEGIFAQNGAVVAVDNSTVAGHFAIGVRANRNSVVNLTDCDVRDNGVGMLVLQGAIIRFAGLNEVHDNATQGILVSVGTIGLANVTPPPELRVENNGTDGIKLIAGNSSFFGGTVIISQNGGDGLLLLQNSTVIKGTPGVPLMGTVRTNNNVGNGIRTDSGSDFSIDSDFSTVTSQNNGLAGVRLDDGSATISGATITGNGTADVELTFVSKLTLNGSNTIGSVSIDPTSVCRDLSAQALCP